MIRVLHLRDTDRICGPGKTILETVAHIDRSRFDLRIGLFLGSREQNNIYYQEAVERGFTVFPLTSPWPYDPSLVARIVRYVEDNHIDIIHSHEYKSDLLTYAAAWMTPVVTITTQHGWIRNTAKSKLVIALQRMVLPAFDCVLAVSEKMRRDLLSVGVPPQRIELIYNAIVADKYVPEHSRRDSLKHEMKLPVDSVLIGNIGRLSPEKGQSDFIAAARILAGLRDDLYFVIVGDGPDRRRLEQQARGAGLDGRVFFLGNILDMLPVYDGLDIVALTSHTEGFPNVVLESMCMEKPVLATNVGGTGEIVQDKTTGILVERGRPDLIAEGIQFLLANPGIRTQIVDRAKQLVLTSFAFSRRTSEVEKLYLRLTGYQ
jgi:glycosyltransferase involved in cell wall biosynthesis